MDYLKRIEDLQKRRVELVDGYQKMMDSIPNTLTPLLKDLAQSKMGDYEIITCRPSIQYTWRQKRNGKYYIRIDVGFKETDPKRNGFLLKFASDLDMDIYKEIIEINHGCSGTYSRDEGPDQISRDILLATIWEHEKEIIDKVYPLINEPLLDELEKVNRELGEIDRTLKQAEEDRLRAEAIKKLNKAKYLCCTHSRYDWDTKTNREYYHSLRRIVKITEKTVFTEQLNDKGVAWYPGEVTREKLDSVIYSIQSGKTITSDIPLMGEVPSKEETSSQ